MPLATRLGLPSATRYGLELNGVSMGLVASFAGGNPVGDVVVETPRTGPIAHKSLQNVRWEEIVLTCGADMSQPFYDWLSTTLNGNLQSQDGAVVAYDYDMVEVWRLSFQNALVSEVGFPALDASSKDVATLCVKFAAQRITRDTSSAGAKGPAPQKTQRNWLLSNFSLSIDGVDCRRVSQIEAMTVTQVIAQNQVGVERDPQRTPIYQQVPNLVVTQAGDSGTTDFDEWAQSFMIDGKRTQEYLKSGALQFLGSNLKDVLFTLQFKNVGIFRVAAIPPSGESVSKIQAEMYCDQMLFSTGGTAVATATAQPGTASGTQISLPTNIGQLGFPVTGLQIQAAPKTRSTPIQRLPSHASAGGATPAQGPRNLKPQQQQPTIPSPSTLRFRNLSSTAEIT